MTRSLCFDAVIFDLDGTLVATDSFWIESAERGARRAFLALGMVRDLPTADQWLSLVGLPLDVGFRMLFPDLGEKERLEVLRACVEEEEAMLRAGKAPAMLDALATVRALREAGLAIGIASNCQQSYLEHMLDSLELRPLVTRAYCRESPGIDSKGDMLARLLADFGTRSAVMVGDRSTDRDAAWENGLPHVHCAFGFAQGDESVEAEGKIGALRELPDLLRRRARWLERALERLGAFTRPGLRLGVTGGPASGKTLVARDLARLLRERGQPAAAISLAEFAPGPGLTPEAGDPLERVLDLARLTRELLRPHEAGEALVLPRGDLLGQREIAPGATLVLEGPFLLGNKLRCGLDRLIHLDVPENTAWQRLRGRDARGRGPGALDFAQETLFPQQHALERRAPPRASAELVLDGTNPLGHE